MFYVLKQFSAIQPELTVAHNMTIFSLCGTLHRCCGEYLVAVVFSWWTLSVRCSFFSVLLSHNVHSSGKSTGIGDIHTRSCLKSVAAREPWNTQALKSFSSRFLDTCFIFFKHRVPEVRMWSNKRKKKLTREVREKL